MTKIKGSKVYAIIWSILSYAFQDEPPVKVESPWFYVNQQGIPYHR